MPVLLVCISHRLLVNAPFYLEELDTIIAHMPPHSAAPIVDRKDGFAYAYLDYDG